MNKTAKSLIVTVFILGAIGLGFFISFGSSQIVEANTYPAVSNGEEVLYYNWKYKNNLGILVNAENDLHCFWKPDNVNDGYKRCEAIIEVENLGESKPSLTNPRTEIILSQYSNKTPIEYYYSDSYSWYNESGGQVNNTEIIIPRRSWSDWTLFSTLSSLNPNNPFAIKAVFEIPQYEANHYIFYLNERSSDYSLNINLDPTISQCTTLDTANNIYTLTQNVDANGTCFIITANNITLDGDGHKVTYRTNSAYNSVYGVYVMGANESLIKNLTIVEGSTSGYGYGIYLKNDRNVTVFDNIISSYGDSVFSRGIRLWSSLYSNVSNNYFNSTSGTAIHSEDSNYSTIIGNDVYGYSDQILTYLDSSNYNNIFYNTINISGSGASVARGMDLAYNSQSNNIVNNTIEVLNGIGIYIFLGAFPNTFENNTIKSYGNYEGMRLNDISNSTFRGNKIYSYNNSVPALRIIEFNNNNIFYDMIINGSSSAKDVFFDSTSSGITNFTNVTTNNKFYFEPNSNATLNIHWYINAYADYTNGSAAFNVNISAWDVNNRPRFSVLTDSNGKILIQTLFSYYFNASGKYDYNNFTFNATRPDGKETLIQSWNVTTNRFLVFTFDVTPPNVTLISPANNSIFSSINVTFTCNVTDNRELKNMSLYLTKIETGKVTYIENNSVWKYNDSNIYPGENWFNESFNETSWSSGAAYLGIETNPVGEGITTQVANCGANPCTTYYFRKNFTVNNASKVLNMSFNVDYDDAYIVYINGKAINTSNSTTNWTSHGQFAPPSHNSLIDGSGAQDPKFPKTQLNSTHLSYLVNGINYIAVAIKQGVAGSSDIAFRLRLEGYENITEDWKLNQTKEITGTQNLTQFNITLEDNSTYKWNCLAYDTAGNLDLGDSNFTLTVSTPKPIGFYQYPTISFYNETTEIILFEANRDVNGTVEYWPENDPINIQTKNLPDISTVHEFNITGLVKGTRYGYRINIVNNTGNQWYSDVFNSSFKTPDYSAMSFKFVVVGDMRAQAGNGIQADVFSNITARILDINPDLVINVGDVVEAGADNYNTARDSWKEYTDIVWNLTDHIPNFISIGNHENPGQQNSLRRYREVVIHPLNGNGSYTCDNSNTAPCWNETTYWFQYGNSLFISLNSDEKNNRNNITGNQLAWLNKTLNMTGFTNKFVFLHKPIKGENVVFNETVLDQMFDYYNVTAVFAGDKHYYCRNNTQTLYIISGGGGAPLIEPTNCIATNNAKVKAFHFINITLVGDTIYGTALNMSNGAVLDTFQRTTPS